MSNFRVAWERRKCPPLSKNVIGHGIFAGSSLANCCGSLNKPIADV